MFLLIRDQGGHVGSGIIPKSNNSSAEPPRGTFMASLVISNEVKNVSTNKRLGWPCWISNCSEKQQHFLKTPGGTFLASLLKLSHSIRARTAILDF